MNTQPQATNAKTNAPPPAKGDSVKCLTPTFRVSYPNVFKAKAFNSDQEEKYSIVMLFPKSEDLNALKRAAFNAATEKWGPKEKWPKGLRMPFRDGDEKGDPTYAEQIFVSASSKQRPGIINQRKEPIHEDEADQFYAGCYARATLRAFSYDMKGNRGVSFGLQNLQKVADGDAFSGKKRAEDDFDAIEDGSDSAENYDL